MSEACDENSLDSDFNERNWNCVTSKAFLKHYLQYLMTIETNKETDAVSTLDDPTQDGKRHLTDSSTSSAAKRVKVDPEHPPANEGQLKTIIKTNDWHEKLCKCSVCLKMYEDHNGEFLFGIKTIECLPTEILLKIYMNLLPTDRRVASECCKRFLELWLCDDFIDDRRLVFDECVLDPEREPLSVFKNSTRIYRTLAFGSVIIRGESVFSPKFGETITTVELMNSVLNEHANEMLSFFSTFSNLKSLKVADIRQLGDFSNVPTTIELLVISEIDMDDDEWVYHEYLHKYLDKTSDSFRVELNINYEFTKNVHPEDILNFTESQRNKIQRVNLPFECKDDFRFHDTLELPRCANLKHLELKFSAYGYNRNNLPEHILDNFEEQLHATKDLSLKIYNDHLPHKNWPCLKVLEAHIVPKEDFSRLSIFENLKELTLDASYECLFIHQPFLNKNLKTLKVVIGCPNKEPCFTCFQTMTKSFPALENFTCEFRVTNNYLEELATNTPKLKSLDLRYVHATVSFACLPNLTRLNIGSGCSLTNHSIETWPLMIHLRKLSFRLPHLNSETVKIFERMSALEELKIRCGPIDGDQVSLFEALSKPLKRLKEINFRCEWIEPEIYPKIIDVMANNCKYLRHRKFTTN